ncbi:MAG: 4Fe-4S binding protein [Anaerovoracaceae bacterium]
MGRRVKYLRRVIQVFWAALTNGYFIGFIKGKIYTGQLKRFCVPGLNCYSCPGSLGSCPIGSLQAVLGNPDYRFSFYVTGYLILIGAFLGRLVCGFLCPFGLIQELINKIPLPFKIKGFYGDRFLRWIKYGILTIFVILLPLFLIDIAGNGSPWFCKWICPAGTLEAGVPLLLTNPVLQESIGFLFRWKFSILIVTILLSIVIYRPFCKYICPLGAIYGLFNKLSIYKYNFNIKKCTHCNRCKISCPMNIDPQRETNHRECIRCGICKDVCAFGAITSGFKSKNPL